MPRSLPVELILLALAAYRTTRLVLTDTITRRFREWWYLRFPTPQMAVEARKADSEEWLQLQPHPLGTLMSCAWCLSVWLSALWVIAYAYWPTVTIWAALPLSLSAVVGKLSERD